MPKIEHARASVQSRNCAVSSCNIGSSARANTLEHDAANSTDLGHAAGWPTASKLATAPHGFCQRVGRRTIGACFSSKDRRRSLPLLLRVHTVLLQFERCSFSAKKIPSVLFVTAPVLSKRAVKDSVSAAQLRGRRGVVRLQVQGPRRRASERRRAAPQLQRGAARLGQEFFDRGPIFPFI